MNLLKDTVVQSFLLIAIVLVECESTSVIIIGAGSSGIAAATRLLDKKADIDVTVLEAGSRIGGRVFSAPLGDAIVELGAQWCHGEKGNAVYDLANSYGLLEETKYNMDIMVSDGRMFGSNLTKELCNMIDDIYNNEHDTDPAIDTMTMGEYFNKKFHKNIQKLFGEDSRKLELSQMSERVANGYILSDMSAPTLNVLSARETFEELGDNLNWMGKGYKQIFDIMMKKAPVNSSTPLPLDDKIHFNKEVKNITWSTKPVVKCTDGSSYTADYVIFTPSLGVLKADHKTLFDPALPNYKIDSIEKLGMGGTMKVIFQYTERWWPTDFDGMFLVWTKEDEEKALKEFPHGPIKDGVSWLSSILGFVQAENNENVLYVWIAGELISEIEKIPGPTLYRGLHYVAEKFFGPMFNVSEPAVMIREEWVTNPHFRGVYSFETLACRGQEKSCHSILAEPLTNDDNNTVLLFAGEATHPTRHSTVDGAIRSGHREADRIIEMVSNTV